MSRYNIPILKTIREIIGNQVIEVLEERTEVYVKNKQYILSEIDILRMHHLIIE